MPGSLVISTRSPALTTAFFSFRRTVASGAVILSVSKTSWLPSDWENLMRCSTLFSVSIDWTACRNDVTRNSVARQSAMALKLSTNHLSDAWT